jgi:polysaccharide export outer membrane protein
MRNYISTCLIIGIALILSSCGSKQYQYLFEPKQAVTDTASAQKQANTATGSYRIKPQDILQIKNLQNIKYIVDETPAAGSGSNNGGSAGTPGQTFQVEDDGTVALPAIGHIKVAGLTRPEAAKQIEDLYRKSLLKDPIIEVKIVNLKITLLGEVKAQGNYTLTKDRTTLVEMIGEAGGLTT